MTSQHPPRIFVQMVAYRDPECHHTLSDLFEKAAHPERVFVGLCWQYDPESDADYVQVPYPRPDQVRVIQYHIRDAEGAGWARTEAQTLWQGEPFILQIQAHHRFEPGWDTTLVELLLRYPSPKTVLTAWLPGYTPPDTKPDLNGELPLATVNRLGGEGDTQLVHLIKRMVPAAAIYNKMLPMPMWVGNFMFTRAETLQEVPFDPYIYFWGEEPNYSARLYTHGYDIFHLDRLVAYHYWDRVGVKDAAIYRDFGIRRNMLSLQRNLHLFGMQAATDAEALKDLDKYPLGRARSLEDFWRYLGVDWAHKTISMKARLGEWTMEDLTASRPVAAQKPRIFIAIASYRDPECSATIADLFAKAAHPDRLRVGVCLQIDEREDAGCNIASSRMAQVAVKQVHYSESKGANWARSEAMALHDGEDYILQIDSHMRFEPGWDEALIGMLTRCPSAQPLISGYLPNYTPPDARDYPRDHLLRIRVRKFGSGEDPQLIHITGEFAPVSDTRRMGLYPSPFIVANFMFARASLFRALPVDPHFHFYGDEISYSARLWTHGIDVFQPDRVVMFHYWVRKETMHLQHYRDTRSEASVRSTQRVLHVLGFTATTDRDALVDIERYGLGNARPLADLWRFAGIDWQQKQLAPEALDGRWHLNARVPAVVQKRSPDGRPEPKIFVSIASYRDRECQWTVKDLFEKATYPDRISVGVCWQFDAAEDKDCFLVNTRPEQVRVLPVDWRQSDGVCWARHLTQMLWEGEEYSLQIDSHMRFTPGWDEWMIEELAACDAPKPVLSCSPASYTPPNQLEAYPLPTIRRVLPFFPDGNIRGRGEYVERVPEKPLNGAFIAAGFVFARSDILREVPYDPYLYFDQEEITYAARLYTHGWDVFSSRRPLLYHYYNVNGQDSARPLHWQDLRATDEQKIRHLRTRGLLRFNHLTGHSESDDPEVLKELERYGFGTARTLKQYEEYCGIDFKRKAASEKALRCGFIRDLARYRDKPIYVAELDQPAAPAVPVAAREPVRLGMLEPGDFLPLFWADDTTGKRRAMEAHAGRFSVMVFLPANNPAFVAQFFTAYRTALDASGLENFWTIFMLDDSVDNLLALKERLAIDEVLTADPDRRIAHALGIVKSQGAALPPLGFIINKNLCINDRFTNLGAAQLAGQLVEALATRINEFVSRHAERRVISALPPAIIIPNAFSPEFCKKLIDAFRSGYSFEGTVGASSGKSYRPDAKLRRDYVVQGELQRMVDDKLSRSVFPEIRKIFGFDVTHREYYKIGLYEGDKGGFFRQHRDNFDAPLGYRRIAMTVHLNDDYEGGGLHFPEYDDHIYRPHRGGAIAFSCATLHEALPVIRGERFVLVAFFHGEQDEAYRRHYLKARGEAPKEEDFTPVLRTYPGLSLSRDFYDTWRHDHVRYGDDDAETNEK